MRTTKKLNEWTRNDYKRANISLKLIYLYGHLIENKV